MKSPSSKLFLPGVALPSRRIGARVGLERSLASDAIEPNIWVDVLNLAVRSLMELCDLRPRRIYSGYIPILESMTGDGYSSASYCLGVMAIDIRFGRLRWPLLPTRFGSKSKIAPAI